jgi:hypothetical protein
VLGVLGHELARVRTVTSSACVALPPQDRYSSLRSDGGSIRYRLIGLAGEATGPLQRYSTS